MASRPPNDRHQTDAAPRPGFDERLWPVNCEIILFAGLIFGVILISGNFNAAETGLLGNGYVHLGVVGVLMVLLFWGVNAFQGAALRRFQLCIFFSLIVHFSLAMFLHVKYLAVTVRPQPGPSENVDFNASRVTVPDYHWDQPNPPTTQQAFERPVETLAPSEIDLELVFRDTLEHRATVDRVSPVEPDPAHRPPQDPVPIRRAEPAPEEEALAHVSIDRHTFENLPRPERVSRPKIAPLAPHEVPLDSQVPAIERRAVDLPHERSPAPAPSVDSPQRQEAAALDRRTLASRPEIRKTEPRRMARAAMGTDLPESTVPLERAVPPAARGGTAAPRIDALRTATAVTRSSEESLRRADTSVAGAAESALGSSQVAAQSGRPRSLGDQAPMVASRASLPRIARSPGGIPVPITPKADSEFPLAAASAATGGRSAPRFDARGTPVGRQNGTGLPTPGDTLIFGTGRSTSPGVARSLSAAVLARSSGPAAAESSPSESLRFLPSRQFGHSLSAEQTAETPTPIGMPERASMAEQGQIRASSNASMNSPQAFRKNPTGVAGAVMAPPTTARRSPDARLRSTREDKSRGSARGDSPSVGGPVVGMPVRRALPENLAVRSASRPSILPRTGHRLLLDRRTREVPVESFRQREPDRRLERAKELGGSEATETAVEKGLEFLARAQFADGHWSLDARPEGSAGSPSEAALGQIRADTAATGLALLAFLGAGYTHIDGDYRRAIGRGIEWLIANQQPNGQLFSIPTDPQRAGRIYGHGIAAIALCEAYGMTRDPALVEPARRAIDFILDAQHPTLGGWRYTPRNPGDAWRKESDTSVSGWQLMALKSAHMAGLDVPTQAMRRVGRWLDLAGIENGARYRYNPYASDQPGQSHGRVPNLAMTAEGLLMRLYLGWDSNHPSMKSGADHLAKNLPTLNSPNREARDAYYWYYATQVMFQMQGDHWTTWNNRLSSLLTKSQVQKGPFAGSWHPNRPMPDAWAHVGGRLYVTAMHLLMLEVYYRHLPLFRSLSTETKRSKG